jgi:hypothetical protein
MQYLFDCTNIHSSHIELVAFVSWKYVVIDDIENFPIWFTLHHLFETTELATSANAPTCENGPCPICVAVAWTRRSTSQWPPFAAYSPNAAIFVQNTAFIGLSFSDFLQSSKITYLNSFYLRGTNGVELKRPQCRCI